MHDVVHIVPWYPPYRIGGTETYVQLLATEQARAGLRPLIATVERDGIGANCPRSGVPIRTYADDPPLNIAGKNPTWSHPIPQGFIEILEASRGAIYHQHAWTQGSWSHHLRLAKTLGFKTVLTAHLPNLTCARVTLLENGETLCDGKYTPQRCASCWLTAKSVPKGLARLMATIPPNLGRAAISLGRPGTALAARNHVEFLFAQFHEAVRHSDRIVAVANWMVNLLTRNGASASQVELIDQGVDTDLAERPNNEDADALQSNDGPLKILFLGRSDIEKGSQTLLAAIDLLPDKIKVSCKLKIADAKNSEDVARMFPQVPANANVESRIDHNQIAATLSQFDCLVVPSIWPETGPLTVLEAKAMGVHVIGSNRAGIAERIHSQSEGTLFDPGNAHSLAAAICEVAERKRNGQLDRTPKAVRTMKGVAADYGDLYDRLRQP